MRKYIFYILLLLVSGCTEPYDIDLESGDQRLVIEGGITSDSIFQQVILTKTVDYFDNEVPAGVNDALVYVTYNDDSVAFKYVDGTNGLYQTEIAFRGISYTRYTLHVDSVVLSNDIGYQSFTASDSMRSVVPSDSIKVEYDAQIEAWWVRLYTNEPNDSEDWYIFKVGINSTLVSDTINEWNITNDEFLSGKYLNGVNLQYLQDEYADERPSVGDTIWLYTENISEEYFNFCSDVQIESGFKIPLFSGQPANVSTNILPNGVGFFSAVARTMQYTIVTELPYEGYDEGK